MELRNLALALLAIPLAGCGFVGEHLGKSISGVQGSGPVKSDTRKVTRFTRIQINKAIQATIAVDGKDSVEIKAQESLLPIITTKVEGGELIVDAEKDYSASGSIQAIIHCASLEGLKVDGASSADVTGVKADKLSLEAGGASHIEFAGEAKSIDAVIGGASTLTLNGKATTAKVDASGASTIGMEGVSLDTLTAEASGASTVHAGTVKSLDAQAGGASTITYKGDPKILRNDSSGASDIKKV